MRIGVHASVRRGMLTALDEAKRLGCETLQIFSRPPHEWRTFKLSDDDASRFRDRRKALGLFPLVVHTPFLPNLSTTDTRMFDRSRRALAEDLAICEQLDADFFIIHPGAYSPASTAAAGMQRMSDAINEALSRGGKTRLLVENMAGGGRRLGSTWGELADLLARVQRQDRIGVCLDTAHTHGAGYAFQTPQEVQATLKELESKVGLARVFVIHANDSTAGRGSHLDLHEHIGQGQLGIEPFRELFREPQLKHCAMIVETPKRPPGSDEKNLAILRQLHSS
jgi:deoxyribonuclease IV